MSTQDDFLNEAPRKQGMSSTAKVLIILGSIAGVCLLACCGGVVFVGWKFQDFAKNVVANLATKDPQQIRDRTAKIIHVEIPEQQFPPAVAIDVVVMKEIIYGTLDKPNRPMLVIVEMDKNYLGQQGGGSAKQQRQEILRAMKQQGQQPGMDTDINEESSETREFDIAGEKVPFEFIKGKASQGGTPTRQVVGVIQGRAGLIMLMIIVPESEYDEAAVVRMLESIRLPDDGADDEAIDQPEMNEVPEKGDANPPAGDDDSAPDDGNKAAGKDAQRDAPSDSSP
jgi:hypothetical protein